MLKNICFVQNNIDEADAFVGLKFENGKPNVYFPRGYSISESDYEVRKDIVSLLSVLKKFSDKKKGTKDDLVQGNLISSFPIMSYLYLINDFFINGYYVEKEIYHKYDKRGKINWKRTIQQSKPIFNGGTPVYLSFIVSQNQLNENSLLSKIHKYCIYESFMKFGWLFTNFMPQNPSVSFNKKLFLSVLKKAHSNTFNQEKKRLFSAMIRVISFISEDYDTNHTISYGVNGFEHIWEKLIDYVFGEDSKEDFFPRSFWQLEDWDSGEFNEIIKTNSPLEPDTILIHNKSAYIIDAKYYRFGISEVHNSKFLPGTTSIHKQITYGEYVETLINSHSVVTKEIASPSMVYNAFIMPFNKGNLLSPNYKAIGIGAADWKQKNLTKNYEYVIGILMDTKHIITTYSRKNQAEIIQLTELIHETLHKFNLQKKTNPILG